LIFATEKELTLTSVTAFNSVNVTLVSGTNTNYTCSYTTGYYSILNITGWKSFMMRGGILKYGDTSLGAPSSYYFIIVNGTRGPSLCFSDMEIEFVNGMNSMVFVLGGKVTLEKVKINNQLDTNWVRPLVFSHSNFSIVAVNLHSCTITNSNYKPPNASLGGSAVVYFIDETTAVKSIFFNISFCLCQNNTFNNSFDLTKVLWSGGFTLFHSYYPSSGNFFFFL
jgi:hypothetical protein